MDLTGLWPFIIVLSIFCGLFIGSWVKRKSQMNFGISQSYISRLEKKIIGKMKKDINSKIG